MKITENRLWELYEYDKTVFGAIESKIKGGFNVTITDSLTGGTFSAFLPGSQILQGKRYLDIALFEAVFGFVPKSSNHLDMYVGAVNVPLKIIKFQRNSPVVSFTAFMMERYELAKDELNNMVAREFVGRVTGVVDYGLFVMFHKGVTGLVHVPEEKRNTELDPTVNGISKGTFVKVKLGSIENSRYDLELIK